MPDLLTCLIALNALLGLLLTISEVLPALTKYSSIIEAGQKVMPAIIKALPDILKAFKRP